MGIRRIGFNQKRVAITEAGVNYLGGDFISLVPLVTIKREVLNGESTTTGNVITWRNERGDNRQWQVAVHEIGHAMANNNPGARSYFTTSIGSECTNNGVVTDYCYMKDGSNDSYDPGDFNRPSVYALKGNGEDFAETFSALISEAYLNSSEYYYRVSA